MYLRLLFLTLVLVILGQTPLMTPMRATAAKVSNPLQYGAYRFSQGLKREFDFILGIRYLRWENLKLNEDLRELRSRVADYEEVKRENEKLKEQLGENPVPGKLILAEVIGRSARGGEATLTINKGSNAGVTEGAAVISKNFLLGEVATVGSQRAEIRLLTDSGFSAAALDQESPDRARGLVKGQYGTAVMLERILPTEQVVVGETIITSGEDGKFEKGLILGKVKKIYGQEADVFKSAELELMVNFDSLEEVFVLQ